MTSAPFERPILTVDVVLLALLEQGRLHVALSPRPSDPFKGKLALPGGFVHTDKDRNTVDSARRILADKLGFAPSHLEQAFTESGPTRDSRGWSASVVYLALHPAAELEPLQADGRVQLVDIDSLPRLAFDHLKLIAQAVKRLRAKASYTSIIAHLLPREFTIPQMQAAFEQVIGQQVNAANFRRKILETGALKETRMVPAAYRPAQAYRLAAPLTDFGHNLF
ncbi:NUDIX hydrolase [Pigmentiphaga litoralis]|uniref:NUDIX hydrolase n=1 Tax=Pigmentiphaga litoralis TaxID=516702 RepID=UPI003B43B224